MKCLLGNGVDGVAERAECLSGFPPDSNDDVCNLYSTTACCIGQISSYGDCLEIDEFVEYVMCHAGHENGQECTDFMPCSERASTPAPSTDLPPAITTPAPSTSTGGFDERAVTPTPGPTPQGDDLVVVVGGILCW